MKTPTMKSILSAVFAAALFCVASPSNAQVFPTTAVLLANHTVNDNTINSTDEYLQMEHSVSILSERLNASYQQYPNTQYTPVYDNDQMIGYVVTGVSNTKDANEISYMLMQLEVIGEMINNVDGKFLPVSANSQSGRVSKRDAIR
jgi:hypothetical protein